MAAPRPAWIEAAVGGACYRELILPVRSIFGTGDPWSRMLAFYSIYKAYFRAALMLQIQYRIAMLIWLLGGVIEPLMYLVVWRTVAQQQGGSVGGYSVNLSIFVIFWLKTKRQTLCFAIYIMVPGTYDALTENEYVSRPA